jgi:hypothetical protein
MRRAIHLLTALASLSVLIVGGLVLLHHLHGLAGLLPALRPQGMAPSFSPLETPPRAGNEADGVNAGKNRGHVAARHVRR